MGNFALWTTLHQGGQLCFSIDSFVLWATVYDGLPCTKDSFDQRCTMDNSVLRTALYKWTTLYYDQLWTTDNFAARKLWTILYEGQAVTMDTFG